MKHAEATYLTKKTLADTLKRAMESKPFSKITVSQIIADCGINRKTFYYHFADICDLLKWTLQQEAQELVRHFDLLIDGEEALAFMMDYVERNSYIIRCAQDPLASDLLKQFFVQNFWDMAKGIIDQAEVAAGVRLTPEYKDFLCRFFIDAVSSLLTEWVRNRSWHDRRAIIDCFALTIRGSILGISQLLRQSEAPADTPATV